MTLGLVTEARPIPWKLLSKEEQGHVADADAWLEKVRADAIQARLPPEGIDRKRSGRVLFIDGARGSGKTSLMLTILEGWHGGPQSPQYREEKSGAAKSTETRVLLPILDFDPLPRGMPLHGWLLEPWRKEAAKLESEQPSRGGSDLSEKWAEVFERAVIGWTRTEDNGKGVIEKALEYQERAAGWIDTHRMWHELVNGFVCRRFGCRKENCEDSHPVVFVVAIDDVDLQVEELPLLLHAIRLLHHPNVAYILTGNYDHLRFVLDLNYTNRHARDSKANKDEAIWLVLRNHSKRLRDAFLEKSLPTHARISLRTWSALEVLKQAVGPAASGADEQEVDNALKKVWGPKWIKVAKDSRDLRIATARRAQHAIDHHLGSKERGRPTFSEETQIQFFADLCGSGVEKRNEKWRFDLRGRLTTEPAAIFRAWEGDRLTIMLTERPIVAFLSGYDAANVQRDDDDDANRALLVQLAVEAELATAPALAWSPDAAIVSTETRWRSSFPKIGDRAVFNWPWLIRPTALEVLELGVLSEKMSDAVPAPSRTDLNETFAAMWLSKTIDWQYARLNKILRPTRSLAPAAARGRRRATRFDIIANRLKELAREGADTKREVERCANEIVVMTAPYFGLPEDVGDTIRRALWRKDLGVDEGTVREEQTRMVKNAMVSAYKGLARSPRVSNEPDPTSEEFVGAAEEFLVQRYEQSPTHTWWKQLPLRDGRFKPIRKSATKRNGRS